jgi:uncharacterized protein (DUF2344 family)|tara:strand:+ start:239 stop:622 length:384 start_codon:yes stop_codon:yes gene_type:complete
MINTWHNNRISEKLNKEFPKDFSICDIDGAIRKHYMENNKLNTRFIIYESKNKYENLSSAQLKTLKLINDSINWKNFDNYSGLFIIKIIDLEDKLEWYNLQNELIRSTTFEELYNIFSNNLNQIIKN